MSIKDQCHQKRPRTFRTVVGRRSEGWGLKMVEWRGMWGQFGTRKIRGRESNRRNTVDYGDGKGHKLTNQLREWGSSN